MTSEIPQSALTIDYSSPETVLDSARLSDILRNYRVYVAQDRVLIEVTSAMKAGTPLPDATRLELYRLPKWRARMLAQLAYRSRRMHRHELDEITRLCRVTPGQQLPIPKELR